MRALLTVAAAVALFAGCLAADPAPVETASAVLPPVLAPVDYDAARDFAAYVTAAVANGSTVTVQARPAVDETLINDALGSAREFELELAPSTLVTPDTWAEVDGVRVPMPEMAVYDGIIAGMSGSALQQAAGLPVSNVVRLVVTPDWSRGTIRYGDTSYLVRIGLDGNLPFALPSEEEEDGARTPDPAWGTRTPPARFDAESWSDASDVECLHPAPTPLTPMLDPGASTADALTARIVMDGDAALVQRLGTHAMPMLVAMLAEVDSIYAHEVGIRFELVGVHLNTDAEYYPDPDDEAPQEQMAKYWNARTDVDRDIVHLVTGHESGYAMANCIGGAGMPELAYTFTPLGWDEEYVVFHINAFAHELGHIFSAHHHYGNHVESGADGATIMIQGYTPGLRPVFGTVEKSVIRGWAEEYLGAP